MYTAIVSHGRQERVKSIVASNAEGKRNDTNIINPNYSKYQTQNDFGNLRDTGGVPTRYQARRAALSTDPNKRKG